MKTSSSFEQEPHNSISLNERNEDPPTPEVEWLIINDGSSDSTLDSVRKTYGDLMASMERNKADGKIQLSGSSALGWRWKIVSLKTNSGKGGAVKAGMNHAEGKFHLMVDADGATDFENGLENLTRELESRMKIIGLSRGENGESKQNKDIRIAMFGSRAHLEEASTAQRSLVRTILMKSFHFFVSLVVSSKVHDTQCGFKLFTKPASRSVFETLHLRRWAFDTEIVMLCETQGIEIIEVGVPWKEIDGSKLSTSRLSLAIVSISMLRDMICVRLCYTLGIWSSN